MKILNKFLLIFCGIISAVFTSNSFLSIGVDSTISGGNIPLIIINWVTYLSTTYILWLVASASVKILDQDEE